jgi:hypothetical protein
VINNIYKPIPKEFFPHVVDKATACDATEKTAALKTAETLQILVFIKEGGQYPLDAPIEIRTTPIEVNRANGSAPRAKFM